MLHITLKLIGIISGSISHQPITCNLVFNADACIFYSRSKEQRRKLSSEEARYLAISCLLAKSDMKSIDILFYGSNMESSLCMRDQIAFRGMQDTIFTQMFRF